MGNVITKNNRLEWGIFALFVALLLFTMSVHEPWFDEIQAWLIARDAPLKDILWLLPHYEGHPPFFHLLLAIPAKLGLGWQWGLRSIGALFSIASAYLIIFKAPFPRWIRLTIPFTYFLFYQYGVIVRPYNIMVFMLCLLAVYFPQKDKRPGLFVGLLAGLCACHLFGIAMAGGITLAWLWEIKNGRSFKEYIPSLWKDKRFYWMLALLGWALLLLLLIAPRPDAFAMDMDIVQRNFWWQRLLYIWIILPADGLITNVYGAGLPLRCTYFFLSSFFIGLFWGGIIWGLIYYFLPHRYNKYLLFPYLLLSGLMIFYAYRHHTGLGFLVILWAFWIAYDAKAPLVKRPTQVSKAAPWIAVCLLSASVGWSLFDIYEDYNLSVFSGQDFIRFLHRHHLEDKRIFTTWYLELPKDMDMFSTRDEEKQNTNHMHFGVDINLYADHNIIANLNGGGPMTYLTHIALTPQQNEQNFALWRQKGIPDLLIGDVQLNRIFPQQPDLYMQYVPVYFIYSSGIWKFDWFRIGKIPVWAHRSLLDKHHLRFIKRPASFDPNY